MSQLGIRVADWGQRLFAACAMAGTLYLGVNLYRGGTAFKTKLEAEKAQREAAMVRARGFGVHRVRLNRAWHRKRICASGPRKTAPGRWRRAASSLLTPRQPQTSSERVLCCVTCVSPENERRST